MNQRINYYAHQSIDTLFHDFHITDKGYNRVLNTCIKSLSKSNSRNVGFINISFFVACQIF